MLELGAPSPKAGSDSDATMHIKLKRSLRWSGAEPMCERNGCHTRPTGMPFPFPMPLLVPCLCPTLLP